MAEEVFENKYMIEHFFCQTGNENSYENVPSL